MADKGDYQGSLMFINKARELNPKLKINRKALQQRAARFYFRQGQQNKDGRKAVEAYRRAVALQSDYAQAWFALGYSLMQLNENETARDAFLRHAELLKNNQRELANTWYNLGLLNQRLGDYAQAEFYSIKALETNKFNYRKQNFGDLHWRIAYAIDKQGRYSESESWYRKSIPIFTSIGDQKSVASLHNNLAGVLEDQGKLKEAERTYRKALQIATRIQSDKQQQRAENGLKRLSGVNSDN
jgi:tetratricopeptide (TPR) repeat protein